MDRSAWLKEKRRVNEAQDDTIYSPIYDTKWGAIASTHQQFFTTTPQSRRSKNGSYSHNFTWWKMRLERNITIFWCKGISVPSDAFNTKGMGEHALGVAARVVSALDRQGEI